MNFLKQIAHDSLIATGKLVESKLVERKKDTLDIDEVIEQGLLKREGANYQFIHLTFQEYLTACYLKDQLINDNIKSKIASFIGEHRNEPKYLVVLKFLAGIVSNDNEDENLVTRFWEAVTCNVDGILELGLETKVTLLMHLLAQSKVNGKIDTRIPNLEQTQKLIDDTILKDITSWEQQIIESGYLSLKIIEVTKFIINEKEQNVTNTQIKGVEETDFQKLKAAIEIITSLANKNEWRDRTEIYEKLVSLLQIEDLEISKTNTREAN